MDMVKKNWFSIVCAVVAVLAIVAVPTFVSSQQKALQKDLEARQKVFNDAKGLQTQQRHEPTVKIGSDAAGPELKIFPGPAVIEMGEGVIKQVQTQSVDLEKYASTVNVHTVLLAGTLPTPGLGSSDAFSFARAYLEELQKNLPAKLDATTPPTAAQIQEYSDAEEKRLTDAAPKAQGQLLQPELLARSIAIRKGEIEGELRRNASSQHKMYMFPSALSIHPDFASGTGQQLDAQRIWFAQLSLWVQQDVVSSIIELNKASTKVETSTVKQLIGIETAFGPEIYTMPNPANGAAVPPPTPGAASTSPVLNNSSIEALPKDITISPTGHVCNGVFDVVHFTVSMHVQAADIVRVIEELQRNRLLTVLQTDLVAVDSLAEKQDGFYYGSQPVVILTLKCEELYLRSWTRPLMPQPVKALLNVQDPPQATASTN